MINSISSTNVNNVPAQISSPRSASPISGATNTPVMPVSMSPVGTPKPELSPLQLFSKLTTYSSSESKDIIRSLNGMFAEKNKTPGDVLIKIIETLIRGASHASHFEALLLALDNGLLKNDPDVVNLFKRLAEGIEQKLSEIDSKHKLPFLSTFLPHKSTLAPKEYPQLRKVIHKQKGELTQIYKVREAKRQALQQMAQQLNPSCLEWNIAPFKFDYKRGIHIETYHLKDTQGRTFEATLLQPEKPMRDVDVRAIVDTTQGLYPGNDKVIVEHKVLLPTDGGHRSAIITLFELSHLKTFGEWRTQENQKMNQSFDGAVGAYINKKTMVTDILNELQFFHDEMYKITALKGKGYSYLNFENIYIVKDYSSTSICFNPAPSICFNPAPIVYQQLHLKEYGNDSGNAHAHATGDSMTADNYIASEVRNNLPKIQSDIYSMGPIWENLFGVNFNENDYPYVKTIGDTMNNRISRRPTISELLSSLSTPEVPTLESLRTILNKNKPNEEMVTLFNYAVRECRNSITYSRENILEATAMYLGSASKKLSLFDMMNEWPKIN